MSNSKYHGSLIQHFWNYVNNVQIPMSVLEQTQSKNPNRPPVFVAGERQRNLILPPDQSRRESILQVLKGKHRHRWFPSMTSSQALTWSVFGALEEYGKLPLLSGIVAEKDFLQRCKCELEYKVNYLGERNPTRVDVMLTSSDYRVAIECKLSEDKIGPCSRSKKDCEGRHSRQRNRKARCPLSDAVGTKYWQHLAGLTTWTTEEGINHCPLRQTYQLVRTLLAACTSPDNSSGHCVLLVDERNPVFQPGGKGREAFDSLRNGLKNPALLRLVTWQSVMERLRADGSLGWLVNGLQQKYGL
ncbi:MAG: hypothetical protein ABIK54_06695 [candidate division WOR-3 bacterium]